MPNTQPGFLELVWREEYACGHPTIDAQHRRLFVLGNALLDAILMEQPKPEIERLLVEFVDHAKEHFSTEESILEAFNSGVSEAHKKLHLKLLEQADTLCAQYGKGKVQGGELASFLIYDLVARHIAKEDKHWLAEAGR